MANVKQIKVIKGNDTFWLKHCVGHWIEVYSKIHEPSHPYFNFRTYRTTDKGTEQIKNILIKYDNQIVAYYINIECVSKKKTEFH